MLALLEPLGPSLGTATYATGQMHDRFPRTATEQPKADEIAHENLVALRSCGVHIAGLGLGHDGLRRHAGVRKWPAPASGMPLSHFPISRDKL